MEQKKYFEIPVQVVFWDSDSNHWIAGIAYQDEIICSCCGSIIEIEDIYDWTPAEVGNPIHEYKKWVDLGEAIIGDMLPSSLTEIDIEEDCSDEENCEYDFYYYSDLQDKENVFKE